MNLSAPIKQEIQTVIKLLSGKQRGESFIFGTKDSFNGIWLINSTPFEKNIRTVTRKISAHINRPRFFGVQEKHKNTSGEKLLKTSFLRKERKKRREMLLFFFIHSCNESGLKILWKTAISVKSGPLSKGSTLTAKQPAFPNLLQFSWKHGKFDFIFSLRVYWSYLWSMRTSVITKKTHYWRWVTLWSYDEKNYS